jgi:hypothetical protein
VKRRSIIRWRYSPICFLLFLPALNNKIYP